MVSTTTEPAAPTRLRLEHHRDGALGVGEPRPRLSWVVPAAPQGWGQVRYEIRGEITTEDGTGEQVGVVVDGADQVLVPWPFRALRSREAAEVRVRVDGGSGRWSEWSSPARVETGLLDPADWSAVLVGPEPVPAASVRGDRRPPLVRGAFSVPDGVRQARLYLSAHGLVEMELNGRRVGRDALAPGWTSYHHRLRYLTYDVTDALQAGENVLGAWLADGWYRGRIGFEGGAWDLYGDDLGVLAQLEVVTADGRSVVASTGADWQWSPGPLVSAQIYDGEHHDARLEQPGWSAPGFDAGDWSSVHVLPLDPALLVAPEAEPVRCVEELAPVTVEAKGDGRWLLDFGQNHSGRLRVRVPAGERGATIRLRHAEVLQDGELYTRPLRQAAATDVLVLDGAAPRTWEPRFTLHGYRYAEVSGWTGPLEPGDVVSRVHHTDMERTGWFWSSEPDLDRLHENVVWSLRSNFVDLPTDCPQRDERLGWTGDIQVFAPTARFLYDCTGLLSSWLRDVSAEQAQYGTVPWYVPFVAGGDWWDPTVPGAVWGDVAVLTPWVLHERTADTELLRRQYAGARAWVEQVESLAGPDRLWDEGMQLGDWLDPAAPPDNPMQALTDPHLVATAYFALSAQRLADTAAVLGLTDDAERFGALAAEVRAAYAGRYVGEGAGEGTDSQTAHALTLAFGLAPDEGLRARAAERLAALVAASDGAIGTGFAGTPLVCDALTGAGRVAEAYRLLMARQCPSWLYPVTMGATTTWERWDSMLPDGTVNPGEMTSFNHYALGAVADWMHRVVAGLAPDAPGYRRLRVAPRPGGGLTRAGARHLTPYGEASVEWEHTGSRVTLRVVVPVGVTAVLDLPGSSSSELGHGTHVLDLDAAALLGT